MNISRICIVSLLLFTLGCNYDIVRNRNVKLDEPKTVYLAPLKTADPYIGTVIRDVVEKEFVRRGFALADSNSATILISGSAFLTERSKSSGNSILFLAGSSSHTNQAVESVSLIAKNRKGTVLATASYDNADSFTVSKLATEFGSAFSDKLKK